MKHVQLKIAAITAALLCLSSTAFATEVSFENDDSLPIVHLNVAIKTGSVSDPVDALGLTNFMGEMLLRGTNLHTKDQIDEMIDQMGAQLAVETRSEALIIRGAVLASQLDPFLSLLQELITQSNFPDDEIKKLKSEVISQILEEDSSDQKLAGLKFSEFLFEGHPFGKPILGKIKTVEKFKRDRIATHYHKLVSDNLLLVVGSGDAKEAKIDAWAQALGKLLPHGNPDLARVPVPVTPNEKRLLLVDKPGRTQTQLTGGQVGVKMTDPDFFPLYVGNHAFGGGSFSARMMDQIRVKRGWSYGAYSYFKFSREPRSWQFYLFPAAKDTPDALAYTLKMIQDVHDKGITKEEFNFAQQSLVNSSGFLYNTSAKRVENKLNERTLGLPDGFMKSYGSRISQVELSQVNEALKTFLLPDRLSIVVLATAKDMKAKIAKAAGIREDQIKVVPYNQE